MALGDLCPHRFERQVEARHHNHGFQTSDGIARRVRMASRQRTFMTSVHRLKHVKSFRTTALTNDDPIGPHTQRVFHQVGGRNLAFAFDIGGSRFQSH